MEEEVRIEGRSIGVCLGFIGVCCRLGVGRRFGFFLFKFLFLLDVLWLFGELCFGVCV